jgi:hypothetical protein
VWSRWTKKEEGRKEREHVIKEKLKKLDIQ